MRGATQCPSDLWSLYSCPDVSRNPCSLIAVRSVLTQKFSKKRDRPLITCPSEHLNCGFAHGHFGMIARDANQNRYRFVFRAAPDRDDRLLLDFDVAIAVNGACQGAKTFLPGNAAETGDGALAQLDVFLRLGDAYEIGRRGVAVVIGRDTVERAPLELARGHRLEEVFQQRQCAGGVAHRERRPAACRAS